MLYSIFVCHLISTTSSLYFIHKFITKQMSAVYYLTGGGGGGGGGGIFHCLNYMLMAHSEIIDFCPTLIKG